MTEEIGRFLGMIRHANGTEEACTYLVWRDEHGLSFGDTRHLDGREFPLPGHASFAATMSIDPETGLQSFVHYHPDQIIEGGVTLGINADVSPHEVDYSSWGAVDGLEAHVTVAPVKRRRWWRRR